MIVDFVVIQPTPGIIVGQALIVLASIMTFAGHLYLKPYQDHACERFFLRSWGWVVVGYMGCSRLVDWDEFLCKFHFCVKSVISFLLYDLISLFSESDVLSVLMVWLSGLMATLPAYFVRTWAIIVEQEKYVQ